MAAMGGNTGMFPRTGVRGLHIAAARSGGRGFPRAFSNVRRPLFAPMWSPRIDWKSGGRGRRRARGAGDPTPPGDGIRLATPKNPLRGCRPPEPQMNADRWRRWAATPECFLELEFEDSISPRHEAADGGSLVLFRTSVDLCSHRCGVRGLHPRGATTRRPAGGNTAGLKRRTLPRTGVRGLHIGAARSRGVRVSVRVREPADETAPTADVVASLAAGDT